MTPSDNAADYAPTQILAELFREDGYDGVVYKSAFGESGFNIALFDLDAAKLINCGLRRIDEIKYRSSADGDHYYVK